VKRIAVLSCLLAGSLAHAESRIYLVDLTLTAEIGMNDDAAGEPVSIAPDLSLLTEGLPQLEIIHSSYATTGFHGIPLGTSFCVTSDSCDDVFHNTGVQLSYAIKSHGAAGGTQDISQTAIAVFLGFLLNDFDPIDTSAKAGLRASFVTTGALQLQLAPNIHIPIDDRDGRDDRLFVPFTLTVPSVPFSAQLETGVTFPFDRVSDGLQIPVGLNISYATGDNAAVLASVSFPAMYGGDDVGQTGFDARVVTVGLRWSKFVGE
jgi:hypothetical protein